MFVESGAKQRLWHCVQNYGLVGDRNPQSITFPASEMVRAVSLPTFENLAT